MCLSVPGKVVSISGSRITVEYGSEKRIAEVGDEGLKKGDYVIVAGGVVVEKIDKEKADKFLEMLDD